MSAICPSPRPDMVASPVNLRAVQSGATGHGQLRSRHYSGPAVSMASPPPAAPNQRQHHRESSQKRATFWRDGMARYGACIIRDMSVSGARLEFGPRATSEMGAQLAVGDWLTLAFETALEQTTATCQVVWVSGARCGVRFQGQFATAAKAPIRRSGPKTKPVKKASWLGKLR